MYSGNNYFSGVNSVSGFFKRIGALLLLISFLLFYIFGVMNFITKIVNRNSNSKGNILISISTINSVVAAAIPFIVIILLLIYFIGGYSGGGKLVPVYNLALYRRETSIKRHSILYTVTFLLLILANIFLFSYCVNEYTVVFKDRIEVHSLINSKKASYTYKDIKEINIGVKNVGRSGSLKYIVTFADNCKVNIAANNLSENDTVDSLQQFSDLAKKQNIPRHIDKTYFYSLVQGLGDEYVKEYEKLFAE